MGISIGDIARHVNGALHGQAEVLITGGQAVLKAGPQDITFAIDQHNLKHLRMVQPGVTLIAPAFLEQVQSALPDRNWITVADPMGAFIEVLKLLRPQTPRPVMGISPQAMVSPSAQIGPDCNIYPGAVIGDRVTVGRGCDIHPGAVISADCSLGDNCTIYPNAVLYPQITLGHRVIVHASAVLGADGFGYRFQQGRYIKIPQLGTVQIEDDVEIGACTTVDRAMIGATVVGEGTKLDNLVMIGHNCELGKHNAFASQVGFAGSVTTGDYVRCAGQVGVADHVHIGAQAMLGAKAGVHRDMEGGRTYLGAPATEEQEQIRIVMALRKLPELRKQLRELEQQVAELTESLRTESVPTGPLAAATQPVGE